MEISTQKDKAVAIKDIAMGYTFSFLNSVGVYMRCTTPSLETFGDIACVCLTGTIAGEVSFVRPNEQVIPRLFDLREQL